MSNSYYTLNHDVNNCRIDSLAILGAKILNFFEKPAVSLQKFTIWGGFSSF
jgi:hypothetical protein